VSNRDYLAKLQKHHNHDFIIMPSGAKGENAVFNGTSMLPYRTAKPILFDDSAFKTKLEQASLDPAWSEYNGDGWSFDMTEEPTHRDHLDRVKADRIAKLSTEHPQKSKRIGDLMESVTHRIDGHK
jgi:hypothetical protein